jgi:Fe-Mn family superoxide dismutase
VAEDLKTLPENLQGPVRNNGGGHANHSLFWTVMSPNGGGNAPLGGVAKAIDADLGGFDKFKDAFTKAALTRFGSGWAWLSVTPGQEAGGRKQRQPGQPADDGNTPILGWTCGNTPTT